MTEFLDPQPPSTPGQGMEKLKIRILYAEDEPSIRRAFVRMFTREGYIVDAVENGQQLLDKLNSEKYDLVVTDNNMPVMTGLEALEQLRADTRFKDLPVIVASTPKMGSSIEEFEGAIHKLGGIYILKDDFRSNFREEIKKVIEQRAA